MNRIKLYVLNNKTVIIIISGIILAISGILIYYLGFRDIDKEVNTLFVERDLSDTKIEEKEEELGIKEYIYVDIKGYVNKPGVYKIEKNIDYRISDLIVKAGGLKSGADTSVINLSKKLIDEMTVIIYSKKEVSDFLKVKETEIEKQKICVDNEVINNACICESDISIDKNNLININTASKEELLTLTNIGEAKALEIISYRTEIGLFTKIEDIMNVSGIGESVFEKIKDNITI